jgi:hypothetical protein
LSEKNEFIAFPTIDMRKERAESEKTTLCPVDGHLPALGSLRSVALSSCKQRDCIMIVSSQKPAIWKAEQRFIAFGPSTGLQDTTMI